MTSRTHRAFGLVATVVVVAAVAWGFWIVGSPETRRTERLDERRIQDLRAIVAEMQDLVWDDQERVMKRELFTELSAVAAAARWRRLTLVDPETGAAYEYRILDAHRYELCATFDMARDDDHAVFWNHPAGRHCWTVDVRDAP